MLVSGYILPSDRRYEMYSTHIPLKVKRKENMFLHAVSYIFIYGCFLCILIVKMQDYLKNNF